MTVYEDSNSRTLMVTFCFSVVLVKERGDVMNGALTAQSMPAKRVGNALTRWVELKKQSVA